MRSSSPTPGCFTFLRRSKQDARPTSQSEFPPSKGAPSAAPAPQSRQSMIHTPPAKYQHYEPCGCGDMSLGLRNLKLADTDLPPYRATEPFSADVRETIRIAIEGYVPALTKLSLYIWEHPELGFHETKAAAKLTSYLESEGFDVEHKYKDLDTSFKATYTHGSGGRTFAFNSEYDALPGIGHACGHNLIAVAGVAGLLGMRAAMKKHNIEGTVTLIGTPAEEGGVGKGILLERGGYKGVDACMMIHPGGMEGATGMGGVVPTLAIQTIEVEFFGRTTHAGAAPWDGINALDAVNIAYSSISAMRQQMHTTDRVHGIITHGGDAPNIIPDYTSMRYYVRSQNAKALVVLVDKVKAIFDAAGLATGCKVKYKTDRMMYDLRNNEPLADEFAAVMADVYNIPTKVAVTDYSFAGASTDFGNVTYALPACHPHYGIPFDAGRSNHTPEFTERCRSPEAFDLTYKFATGMAATGARFLTDDTWAKEATKWWKDDMDK